MPAPEMNINTDSIYEVTITTPKGTIVMDLDPQLAPKTVNNFVNLANNGYYTGLTWLSDTPKPSKKTLEGLWAEVQAEIAEERQARLDAKASAMAKLEALGLTVEEVSSAFGIEV